MDTQDQNENVIDPASELNNLLQEFEESTKEFEEQDALLAKKINDGLSELEKELDEVEDNLNAIEEAYS